MLKKKKVRPKRENDFLAEIYMAAKVVKIEELDVSKVQLESPLEIDSKTRLCKIRSPTMVQTSELTYTMENKKIEILCSPAHADVIHEVDDVLINLIAENAQQFFGRELSTDNVERMFRPTLQGNRNPRQVLDASSFKCFDSKMQIAEDISESGVAMFILRLESVKFEEKACEVQWTVVQAREVAPPPPPAPVVVEPMFLA